MTSPAEYLHALQPFSSKNAFCAETLSCPAIAVQNNVFMTSQHDLSFSAHWPCPGLHVEPAIGSSATHQKSFDYRYYCITMKVSRDYICNLIQHRKTQSLYEKKLIGPKRAVYNFFQSSMGGGLTHKIPPPPVRTPLLE